MFKKCDNKVESKTGNILKCPFCGDYLRERDIKCPSCGCEINTHLKNGALEEFSNRIRELNIEINNEPIASSIGYSSWSNNKKIGWIILNVFTICIPLTIYNIFYQKDLFDEKNLSSKEMEMVHYIRSYQVSSNASDYFEITQYIEARMEELSIKKGSKIFPWIQIWYLKAMEIKSKWNSLNGKDSKMENELQKIEEIYISAKKKQKTRLIISILVSIAVITAVVLMGLFNESN